MIGHDAYRTNAVETASPEQLTLMCYDGALRFMRRAAKAIDEGDLAEASNATGRAQAIVNELNITLDMEAGGERLVLGVDAAQAREVRDVALLEDVSGLGEALEHREFLVELLLRGLCALPVTGRETIADLSSQQDHAAEQEVETRRGVRHAAAAPRFIACAHASRRSAMRFMASRTLSARLVLMASDR